MTTIDLAPERDDDSLAALIARVNEAAQRAESGTLSADEAIGELAMAGYLIRTVGLRAYPMDGHPDETKEHVVITVHGVDVSIRGREDDLFVHIDSTERDTEDAERYPLVVEVNNGGENEY